MPMTESRAAELRERCRQFRVDVLKSINRAQSGHCGGSLSVCEILTLLYQKRAHLNPQDPKDPTRDRIVLGKGHAAPMLYRNLAERGLFPNRHFWARGYFCDTVGKSERIIQEYIRDQLEKDVMEDRISLKEFTDPFTGKKSK